MDSCEYCGGDLGTNSRFCSNECQNESMKNRIDKTCLVCGEQFEVAKSVSDRYTTCSNRCKTEKTGPLNKNWRPKKLKDCDYCGEQYEVRTYDEESSRFCSVSCKGDWYSENKSGEDSWNWKGSQVELTCEQCGEDYITSKYQTEAYNSRFCSNECKWEWQDENFHLEGHPNWKGGYSFPKGPSWMSQREKALNRDGWSCQGCGVSDSEYMEERGYHLDVHHIVPYREFDSDEEAHQLSNLVTLCRDCHNSIEPLSESEQRLKLAV